MEECIKGLCWLWGELSRLAVTSGDPMDPPLPHLALVQLLAFNHGTSQFGDLEAMGVMSAMFQGDSVTHFRGGFQKQREPITRESGEIVLRFQNPCNLHDFIYHLWVCRVGNHEHRGVRQLRFLSSQNSLVLENHFEVATNCAMFLPDGRVCNMLAWKSSYYPKTGETAIAGCWMNNRAPKATESHRKGISDPICSFHKIQCNHSKCRWDSIREKIKNWYCKYLLEGFEGFLWKLKHIPNTSAHLGENNTPVGMKYSSHKILKIIERHKHDKSEVLWSNHVSKDFKFHQISMSCQESIQKLAKFSMRIHRNQAPQRRSSSGPGDPEKDELRGRSITCLCGWHQFGKFGSKCPNYGKSIFQSLICSILMIAIGELDLKFSSWWHESTCWFGCFMLSWCCFSRHVHVEQDVFQAHPS